MGFVSVKIFSFQENVNIALWVVGVWWGSSQDLKHIPFILNAVMFVQHDSTIELYVVLLPAASTYHQLGGISSWILLASSCMQCLHVALMSLIPGHERSWNRWHKS